jgi:hypothetical protein
MSDETVSEKRAVEVYREQGNQVPCILDLITK